MSNLWKKYKEDQRKALQSSPAEVSLGEHLLLAIKKVSDIKTKSGANTTPIEDETTRKAVFDQITHNKGAVQ